MQRCVSNCYLCYSSVIVLASISRMCVFGVVGYVGTLGFNTRLCFVLICRRMLGVSRNNTFVRVRPSVLKSATHEVPATLTVIALFSFPHVLRAILSSYVIKYTQGHSRPSSVCSVLKLAFIGSCSKLLYYVISSTRRYTLNVMKSVTRL